jgi:hypothetical protein
LTSITGLTTSFLDIKINDAAVPSPDTLDLILPVSSLIGYTGGPICSGSHLCFARLRHLVISIPRCASHKSVKIHCAHLPKVAASPPPPRFRAPSPVPDFQVS